MGLCVFKTAQTELTVRAVIEWVQSLGNIERAGEGGGGGGQTADKILRPLLETEAIKKTPN
jgi:hypothetical protein